MACVSGDLKSLIRYLQERSQGHHTIDHLEERTRKGHRKSNEHWNWFKGRERAIVSETDIGTGSKATVANFLEAQWSAYWVFEREDLELKSLAVISKETVGNSWDTVNVTFGHEHHHNHPKRFISTD